MRKVDDKIIYSLNTSIPTESFKGQLDPVAKCRDLHNALQTAYNERTSAIRGCVYKTAEDLKTLKAEKEKNEGDFQLNKKFKSEQRKLRLFQQELTVEDIIKERTSKIFNERCRTYFKA